MPNTPCLIFHSWEQTSEQYFFEIPEHDVSLGKYNIHEPREIVERQVVIRTCSDCGNRQIKGTHKWINWPHKEGDNVNLQVFVNVIK